MTIYGRSEEVDSRGVECDQAEPESLTSLGGSAPGLVDGILSSFQDTMLFFMQCNVFLKCPTSMLSSVRPHG